MRSNVAARYHLVLPDPGQLHVPRNTGDLWDLFLRDKAARTRDAYASDLRCFARFCRKPSVVEAIDELLEGSSREANAKVFAYRAYLKTVEVYRHGDDPATADPIQIGYAPWTISSRIYALRSVVELARLCGLVDWTISVKVLRPERVRDVRGCGPAGYAAILEALDQAIASLDPDVAEHRRELELALRDRVLIRLLHDSGLRRVETLSIEWPIGVMLDAVGQDGSPFSQVLVLRKGKTRHRWVPISTPCAQAIREYLDIRGHRRGHLLLSTHLKHRGRRIDKATINRRVAVWAERAKTHVTPHGLRHTATTTALDMECGDMRTTSRWSGHADTRSLASYDDARRQDALRITESLADPTHARPHDR